MRSADIKEIRAAHPLHAGSIPTTGFPLKGQYSTTGYLLVLAHFLLSHNRPYEPVQLFSSSTIYVISVGNIFDGNCEYHIIDNIMIKIIDIIKIMTLTISRLTDKKIRESKK